MYKLLMSEEQITATISELESVSSSLSTGMEDIRERMDELNQIWQGHAEQAYAEVYQALKSSFFDPMIELLKSYPQTLLAAKNTITYKDEENAAHIIKDFSAVASA